VGAGIPIALVNHGRARAEDLASVKLDADCARTLTAALRLCAAHR